MTKRRLIIVAIVALATDAIMQGATLQGSVRTADGDPIAARVTILRSSGGVELDTRDTAADGTFSIEVDSSGLIAAAASAPHHASDEIDLSNGVPSRRVRFVLHELQTVRGTVTDSMGRTVAGAKVSVRGLDLTRRRRLQLDYYAMDETDESGKFHLAIPAGGSVRFVADVEAEGWVPRSSGVLGSGSPESVLVELESRGFSLSGTVSSPSGSDLRHITVLATVKTGPARAGEGAIRPYGRTFRARAVTVRNGRYEIDGLPGADGAGCIPQMQQSCERSYPCPAGVHAAGEGANGILQHGGSVGSGSSQV